MNIFNKFKELPKLTKFLCIYSGIASGIYTFTLYDCSKDSLIEYRKYKKNGDTPSTPYEFTQFKSERESILYAIEKNNSTTIMFSLFWPIVLPYLILVFPYSIFPCVVLQLNKEKPTETQKND